jgi:DNA polymerase-1
MQSKKIILAIDSHALLHRSYHAMAGFRTSTGKPSGAIFGFLKMILTAVKEIKPEYVLATYDLPKPTFRHLAYDGYKGARQKGDDDLYTQIDESKRFCEALGIPILQIEGYEADDILGTISCKFDMENYEIVIVSGDMDTMQLVRPGVKVFTMKKGTETSLYDEAAVFKKYGIHPHQIADYKGLAGDTSDNIPGVAGVGEKTACKLIAKFETVENLYENLENHFDEVVTSKIVSKNLALKILENKEEALFSKTLATIKCDVPVEITLPHKFGEGINEEKYKELCDEYELRSLRSYFDVIELKPPEEIDNELLAQMQVACILLYSEKSKLTLDEMRDYFKIKGSQQEVRDQLIEKLKAKKLYEYYRDFEEPLFPIIKHMEKVGILVDQDQLEKQKKHVKGIIEGLEQEIYKIAGKEFLISSPKQLGEVLYDDLKILEDSKNKIKKTSTGARTTNADMLEKLKDEHEIIPKILEWREAAKIYGTYLEPMNDYIHGDGRIHPRFVQAGAATGRFSCENPNMQNLPTKSELGQAVKKIFITQPGYKFLSFDYSQIDLRAAAMLSQDPNLLKIFESKTDVHRGVAATVLHKDEKDVTDEERRKAKAINFGILYGMGVSALKEAMHTDRKEAQEFYDNYKNTFSVLMEYLEKVKEDAKRTGYTVTYFGRHRDIPMIRSQIPFVRAQGDRMAINAPMQGTSADIIKLGMINVWNEFQEYIQKDELRMLLQIHDELVFEVKTELANELAPKIKKTMESVVEKKGYKTIALVVSSDEGNNLAEL